MTTTIDSAAKVTYRFAPEYLIADTGTKIKGSVGTGFKAPTLSQLFQSFPDFFFFANPNLRPETDLGWDAGFEQPLFHNSLRFGMTYFRINIKDLIEDNADLRARRISGAQRPMASKVSWLTDRHRP